MNLLPKSLAISAVGLLLTTHPLPAPIQEIPESPTPAPERQARTKKAPTKSKAVRPKAKSESKPLTALPTRRLKFAGIWTGHVDLPGCGGEQQCTVTIAVTENFVSGTFEKIECSRFDTVPTINGDVMTWKFQQFDGFLDYDAALTLMGDGQTATYTLVQRHWYTGSGTVTRVASGPTLQIPQATTNSTPQRALADSESALAVAKPVPGKPGFVYNPFDSNTKVLLDVRGKASGTRVKDPLSGKLFIVP